MTAPVESWVWDGHAAHLIVGSSCQFHLATRVGDYIVSTVGEYRSETDHPDGDRNYAETGDYAAFTTIGVGRLFETYVFRAVGSGFGKVTDYSEIDALPANDHDTATANHMTLCRKYARRTVRSLGEGIR